MNLHHIYLVHRLVPRSNGTLERHLTGKFALDGDKFYPLCDYHGLLESIGDGKLDGRGQRKLERLFDASYYSVTKKPDPTATTSTSPGDLAPSAGEAPEPLDEGDPNGQGEPLAGETPALIQNTRPPSIFDYHRVGMDKPHTVEFHEGRVLLDGNELSPTETHTVISNIGSGLATLRYRKGGIDYRNDMNPQTTTPEAPTPVDRVRKFERFYFDLAKAEGLAGSLDALRALVAAGHLKEDHYNVIRRELYHDEMVPSIGNKRAFHEHLLDEGRGGVHVMLDANNLKAVNDELSHDHGDQAIKAIGNALRRVMDTHIGADMGKVHRFGGDEFHVHVPTNEHAALFLRALRNELESLPAVGGTHRLSMSAGVGLDKDSADAALNHGAKSQKKEAIRAAGRDPEARVGSAPDALYAYSNVPGFEGPVPTSQQELAIAPPGDAKKVISEAAKIHSETAPVAAVQ